MMSKSRHLLVLAAILVALARADVARAGECAVFGVTDVAPASGATDVPTNAVVFAHFGALGDEPRLQVSVDGAALAGVSTTIVPGIIAFRSEAPLPALTRVDVVAFVVNADGIEKGSRFESFFTTGDAPLTAPSVPPILSVDELVAVVGNPEYESVIGVRLRVDRSDALLLIDRDESAQLDDSELSGVVTAAVLNAPTAFVGRSLCSSNWPDADPGVTATFRAGLVDGTGRFSGWSAPLAVELPPFPGDDAGEGEGEGEGGRDDEGNGAGCSATTPPPGSLFSLCVLLALLASMRTFRQA